MTDLHARLTELLQGHVLARVDRHAWWCSCRADCTTVEGPFAGHLASVLLSAAGVAVVELPEPDDAGRFYYRGLSYVYPDHDGLIMTSRDTTYGDADEVREFAAALLAAAHVAEGK